MKQVKRKRKTAPAATSVAMPVAAVANAIGSPVDSTTFGNVSADYALGAICTIREGAALKSALLELEEADRTVIIDVQSVERIDTSALQLLCAFVRERRAFGRRTRWTGSPAPFTEAVEILGLTQALGYAAEKAA